MTKAIKTKLIREGKYIAEVDVDRIETQDEWSPHLSLDDALKLDEIRRALQNEDIKTASQLGRIYMLTPVANAK